MKIGLRIKGHILFLLLAGTMTGYAQEYFTYEDEGKTIIKGLTSNGETATELTIPATVTTVRSGAFSNASSNLTSLTIDDGNPAFAFESNLFGEEGTNTLTSIDMGKGMSVANMIALLKSLGTFNAGTTIVAYGFLGEKDSSNETWSTVTWDNVTSITLPAELVGDQEFGTATVYGRFTIDKEIISFCTTATFMDDENNNMLFYVADSLANDGRLHIQRVWYVAAGKGVLIHRTNSSCGYANLLRTDYSFEDLINQKIPQAITDKTPYENNMLKGVTTATTITATDGNYTNYVLKDGAFHPTSRGTIKANRAYLQIPTASARTESLAVSFDEETGISDATHLNDKGEMINDNVYDLQGRKVHTLTKGLYINNGKKYVIK
ncbi:MAG: hypothetical protein K5896_04535 [Prevotella sp.]|nr:hypothetical protein [Prevotella sp.]